MRAVAGALLLSAASTRAAFPDSPADSFTADVTFNVAGIEEDGTIAYDSAARRSVTYHANSKQTTIVIQADGYAETFTYNVIPTEPAPTCTCQRHAARKVDNPWYIFLGGTTNSSGCSGGSLFTNPMKGFPGSGVAPPPSSICINGKTPVYTTDGVTKITYKNFKPGRPSSFNISALDPFLPSCGMNCNGMMSSKSVFQDMHTPSADLMARVARKQRGEKVESAPKAPKAQLQAAAGDLPQDPPMSFTADVTFLEAGLTSKGKFNWDSTARRAYQFHADTGATKIVLQEADYLETYVYTVINTQPSPTCTCKKFPSREVSDPWYVFMGGSTNSSGCSGGSLYTNEMKGYAGSNTLPPPESICLSGTTPKFTEAASVRITYDSFTAGRPTTWNTTALEKFLPDCSKGCNSALESESLMSFFHEHPLRIAKKSAQPVQQPVAAPQDLPQVPPMSYSADVTFLDSGFSSKGTATWDAVARRATTFHEASQQTKIVVQDQHNAAVTYVYTIVPTKPTPTCVCQALTNTEVVDPWYIYMGGAANSSGCSGGSLYTNPMVGFVGNNVPAPPRSICLSGTTPKYTTNGVSKVTFDTFKAGRPDFNTSALEPFLPNCAMSCNSVRGSVHEHLFSFH